MMLRAWPKTILSGHRQEIIKNAHKTGLQENPITQGFGQPAERRKNPVRAGLYARVSTHDQQTLSLQRRAMRDYAGRRGWSIIVEVKEVGSGASGRERRRELIDAAQRRDIDVVIVWRLDRWGRSMADLVTTLQELRDLGIGFVSLTEALDLTTRQDAQWRACWPCSPSLNGRSCANVFALVWLTPVKTGSGWGGLRQHHAADLNIVPAERLSCGGSKHFSRRKKISSGGSKTSSRKRFVLQMNYKFRVMWRI
jgi:predicted site-specific integrase-resolvase